MKKKIAIFGGSFNPPHIGHRRIVELVRDSFKCDEIWILPSGDRADKKMHVEKEHRLALTHLMLTGLQKTDGPTITISEIELNRSIPTTTIDTLRELEQLFPDNEFHFVISSELVPDIRKFWHDGQELFLKAKFLIFERPGSHKLTDLELPVFSTIIHSNDYIPLISSTSVRAIGDAKELYQWTDPEVADYIIKNKIYGFK